MKKFYFCCKNDITREIISKCECKNIENAVEYFAKTKNLTIDSFLELFDVLEC